MCRILLALLLGFTFNASAQNLEVKFLGNAGVQLSDGETTLFVDFPYESGAFGYMTYDASLVRPVSNSYCVFTHAHRDHYQESAVKKIGCITVGPGEVKETVKAGNFRVIPLKTPHRNIAHQSYKIEWNESRLYFTGDTESAEVLNQQKGIDVLFVTPWLAKSVSKGQKIADRVVIYHHAKSEKIECDGCIVPNQGERINTSLE